ncbi:MAG: ABC transporter ATP-binding protein [Kineosporiaceae bacterium]
MDPSTAGPVQGPVITSRGLTKRYGTVTAVSDLDLDVPPGITGLVGANGAGKSTLIRILLGLLPATTGGATVLGLDVATDGPAIRRRVGYMPEHDPLPPDVTATEFVVHMGRMSGLPHADARERAADTLRHVGLFEARYRAIGGYSTGMRQRVRLAQALVHDPDLVLLDEPTNGLDPAGRDEMLALVRRIGSDFGISVLVTSHLLGELERISDHVVVIDGGRLLRSTATAEAMGPGTVLVVEVSDGADDLVRALAARGLTGVRHGALVEIELGADLGAALDMDAAYDVVRDALADLGTGLIRLERRRHRLSEIFRPGDGTPAADDSAALEEVPA